MASDGGSRAESQGAPFGLGPALFPFESRFLDALGCRLHYLDEGIGPTLLMLHGNPTWSFLYRDIIGALRPRYRCLAPDYPGFGLSTAPAGYGFTPAEHATVIERFVLGLDLDRVILVMQDWGGPIGLAVAARHPERVAGLVIGNTWAWPVNGDLHFEWFSRLLGGAVGRFLIINFNVFVNVLIPAGVTRGKVPAETMAAYRAPFARRAARRPTHVFPRQIIAGRPFLAEVEAGLARLAHLPTLIVWGDRDIAFRAQERRRFEALFPEHETVILAGAGHFIQEDAPNEIAAAIDRWWMRMTAARVMRSEAR